jgi:hypothetical protein
MGSKAEDAKYRLVLVTAIQLGNSVSPMEVEWPADLVIAVIGLVFSGVGTARTIWDWRHDRGCATHS